MAKETRPPGSRSAAKSSVAVVWSVNVTVPAVTASSPLDTDAVNVTESPTTDRSGVDASTVVVPTLTSCVRASSLGPNSVVPL